MKVEIIKKDFLKNIKMCSSICIDNSINPIFNVIEINFNKNNIFYKSVNNLINLKITQKNNFNLLDEEFKITIKSKLILNLISKITEEKFIIEKNDTKFITIKSNSFSCNLLCLEEILFPEIILNNEKDQEIKINFSKLNDINKYVSFATLTNYEEVSVFSGINIIFNKNNNKITSLGTDKIKLVRYEFENNNINKDFNVLIESHVLNTIVNIFNENTKDLDIILVSKNNQLILYNDEIIINTKQILGEFPNLEKVFNIDKKTTLKINKRNILEVLERTLIILSKEKQPYINMKIGSNLIIEANSYELGSTFEEINNLEISGIEQKIKINPFILFEMIKKINSDIIYFDIDTNIKPIVIHSDDLEYKQIILPMRE